MTNEPTNPVAISSSQRRWWAWWVLNFGFVVFPTVQGVAFASTWLGLPSAGLLVPWPALQSGLNSWWFAIIMVGIALVDLGLIGQVLGDPKAPAYRKAGLAVVAFLLLGLVLWPVLLRYS